MSGWRAGATLIGRGPPWGRMIQTLDWWKSWLAKVAEWCQEMVLESLKRRLRAVRGRGGRGEACSHRRLRTCYTSRVDGASSSTRAWRGFVDQVAREPIRAERRG